MAVVFREKPIIQRFPLDARTGKVITPAKYWSFEMISKDLISAELGYGEEGVILDKRGRVVAYSRDGKRTYFA